MKKVIGIDVGGSHISAGIVDKGKVLKFGSVNISRIKTKKEFFSKLFGVIDKLVDKSIKSIGIGFPAPIIEGYIPEVQNMAFLGKTNLKKNVEKKYKVKCIVENDANVFALAEQRFGAAKGKKNVVGITLGTGLGCGIVVNGKIYSGSTGAAGEISKIPFNGDKLENFVNTNFINKRFGKDPKELEDLAREGNKKAIKAWQEFGKNLGKELTIVVDALDPEIIVLGGRISNAYPLFIKSVMPEIKKHSFKHTSSKLRIVKSKLKNPGVIGAASLVQI